VGIVPAVTGREGVDDGHTVGSGGHFGEVPPEHQSGDFSLNFTAHGANVLRGVRFCVEGVLLGCTAMKKQQNNGFVFHELSGRGLRPGAKQTGESHAAKGQGADAQQLATMKIAGMRLESECEHRSTSW